MSAEDARRKFRGLKTKIGIGLAALGRPGYINLGHSDDLQQNYGVGAMQAHAHAVLDSAWSSGVRYLDAARSYGRAEQFLSTWLASRNIPPEEAVVGSKWGYTYTAGWHVEAEKHEVKEHSLAVLQQQVGESEGLLGAYGLALYQIHSATLDSGVLDNLDVLRELVHIRETRGILIGLTLSGTQQADVLRRALAISIDGSPVFDAVQATYNVLEQSVAPALAEAHAHGVIVIIKEALANGRLTQRNRDPLFSPKLKVLEQVAEEAESTIDAVALAAVASRPFVDIVLSGAATAAQLESNLKASHLHFSAKAEARLFALVQDPHQYWTERAALAWN